MSKNTTELFVDTFAYLFDTEAKARKLLKFSGVGTSNINFKGAANIFWTAIFTELEKQSKEADIIENALGDYPEKEELIVLKNALNKTFSVEQLKEDANKISFILKRKGFSSSFNNLLEFQINASYFIKKQIISNKNNYDDLIDEVKFDEFDKIDQVDEALAQEYLEVIANLEKILLLKGSFKNDTVKMEEEKPVPRSKSSKSIKPKSKSKKHVLKKNHAKKIVKFLKKIIPKEFNGTLGIKNSGSLLENLGALLSSDEIEENHEPLIEKKALVPQRNDLHWNYNVTKHLNAWVSIKDNEDGEISHGLLLKGGYILAPLSAAHNADQLNKLEFCLFSDPKVSFTINAKTYLSSQKDYLKYCLIELVEKDQLPDAFFVLDRNYAPIIDARLSTMFVDIEDKAVEAYSGSVAKKLHDDLFYFDFNANESFIGGAILNEAFNLIAYGVVAENGIGGAYTINSIIDDILSQSPNDHWPFLSKD